MMTAAEIADALPKNRRNGRGWVACCPAHADKNPSLSIDETRDGKVLLHCHAGCPQDEVIDALRGLGLWPEALNAARAPAPNQTPRIDTTPILSVPTTSPPPDFRALLGREPTDYWDYQDADGKVLGYTVRSEGAGGKKEMRPVTWCNGAWKLKAFPEPRPLYGLRALAEWPDAPVLVVEGEKTAVAASNLLDTYVVVTWPGGCGAVGKADWSAIDGRDVVIWPDADEPGIKAASEVVARLPGARVVVVPDGLPKGWDLADDIPEGIDVDKLVAGAQVPPDTVAVETIKRIVLIHPAQFTGRAPERRWVVQDWIPWGHVTMLSGDGGIGKSLILQQLLTCAAIGHDWLGQRVTPIKTLGVFCEDDEDELWRRQDAINLLYGVTYTDLTGMAWICRLGMDNAMMIFPQRDSGGERTPFFDGVVNSTKEFGAHLVGLDALHDLFLGNENARPQARQFIHALSSIATEIDGAVLVTAHPSLSGLHSDSGTSGSTAWNNAVRSRLYLKKPKVEDGAEAKSNERVLKREKANYAGIGDEIDLTWANGVFTHQPRETGVLAAIKARTVETAFLELVDTLESEGRPVSQSANSINFAPRVFARRPDQDGYSKKQFVTAMESLFIAGKIRNVEYGRAGDSRYKIAHVATEEN